MADYAIYMLDPKGIITTWNSGAEKIKGYSASEIIGRDFELFFAGLEGVLLYSFVSVAMNRLSAVASAT